MIQFGVMANTHPLPGADLTRMVDEVIAEAQHAERCGFDSFFLTEHHQEPAGYFPSPLPLAAAIAARTSTIRIGTGIAILPLYHPTRLAEDCAVIDIISKGRLILGVGQGYQEGDFAALRPAGERPRLALRGRHRDPAPGVDRGEGLLRGQAPHAAERHGDAEAGAEAASPDLGRGPRRRADEAGGPARRRAPRRLLPASRSAQATGGALPRHGGEPRAAAQGRRCSARATWRPPARRPSASTRPAS